jgi:ubiquinone/menaquinone biosynthesis C-methylase UbiE
MGHASHPAATHGHVLGAPRLYDAVVDLFFFGRRHATFQALLAAAGVQPGLRVLDVGCGTGYFARLLGQTVGPGGLVIAVDPSPAMLTYARNKARGIGHCQFQIGTAESLDFPDDHFDVVVSSLVLHHLPEELRLPALREMRRVLQPGGRVLVAEAQVPRHGGGWRLLARLYGYDRLARVVPHLGALVAEAGFDEIRTGGAPPWLRYARAVKTARAV